MPDYSFPRGFPFHPLWPLIVKAAAERSCGRCECTGFDGRCGCKREGGRCTSAPQRRICGPCGGDGKRFIEPDRQNGLTGGTTDCWDCSGLGEIMSKPIKLVAVHLDRRLCFNDGFEQSGRLLALEESNVRALCAGCLATYWRVVGGQMAG